MSWNDENKEYKILPKCELLNNEIYSYDVASESVSNMTSIIKYYTYIGEGYIIEIKGKKTNTFKDKNRVLHFWKYKNESDNN